MSHLSNNPAQVSNASKKVFEPILGVETPALIKRGYLFLEESNFDEAERYFEQALRQDPENSKAYLGKLMAELKIKSMDSLPDRPAAGKEPAWVSDTLECLPPKDRRMLLLFYQEQLPQSEIARMLRIPEGTVKSRLSKGRKLLKAALENDS